MQHNDVHSRAGILRFVVLCFLATLALLALPLSSARAQEECPDGPCDYNAPVMWFTVNSPVTSPTKSVHILWCDNISLARETRQITLGGQDVVSQFTYGSTAAIPGCAARDTSVGQVTVSEGTTLFWARICDFAGNCGENWTYLTYQPPVPDPVYLIEVTPDHQQIDVDRNQIHTQWFTVRNAGSTQVTYNLTRTCSGAGYVSGCTPATEPVTLSAGQSVSKSIQVTMSATPGQTASLALLAVLSTNAAVRDSGEVNLRVTPLGTPGVEISSVNPGVTVERDLCLSISAGASAASECADLRVVHALPAVQTMNRARIPVLHYNSNHAHPVARVAANVTLPNDGLIPTTVGATLVLGTIDSVSGSWAGSDWLAGSTRRIALSLDALGRSTGLYPYTLRVTRNYSGGGSQVDVATGELVIVNRASSPFGTGWWLAGLEELQDIDANRKLWIGGDGSARVFTKQNPSLWTAPNVDRLERLEFDGTTYCRRLADKGCVVFDAAGKHIRTQNRLAPQHAWAHRTHFRHSGTLLARIVLPITNDSLVYSFAYDGSNKLVSVTSPPAGGSSRVTQFLRTAGLVDSIIDPGGAAVRFTYDGGFANRILSRKDRRGTTTTFTFGSANVLTGTSVDMAPGTIAWTFAPQETKGLSGTSAVVVQEAFTRLDGPRTDVGDTTRFWLDRFAAPSRIRDANGNESVLTRANSTFPALVTEVRSPNGRVVQATHDAHGNILTSTDVDPMGTGNAVTTFAWDTTWSAITQITQPTGEIVQFGYDASTGNRTWQQPGTDQSYRVRFYYDALLMLKATEEPGSPAPRDSIGYDALGNVSVVRSPVGVTSFFSKDAIGRDTLIRTPIDSAQTQFHRQRLGYDILSRPILEVAKGDGAADSVRVLTWYDAEANVDSLWTRSDPDINSIGWVKRRYTYDRANRKTAETLVGDRTDTWEYDAAGNVLWGTKVPSMTYDALSRVVMRQGNTTGRFTYDAAGNVLTANNEAARITRAYHRNGALKADTTRLSGTHEVSGNFSLHLYGLGFNYDLSGRRTALKLPATLDNSPDSVTYRYESVFGQLREVKDLLGRKFTYRYDLLGRLAGRALLSGSPDSLIETRAYDRDSRLTRRILRSGSDSVQNEILHYDGRGKLVAETRWGDWYSYDRLGHVIAAHQFTGPSNESFWLDALGNRRTKETPLPVTTYLYQAGTARLLKALVPTDPAVPDTTVYWYTGSGNQGEERSARVLYQHAQGQYTFESRTTLSDYNAEQQLTRTQFYFDTIPIPGGTYQGYMHSETYRYDALGRRVFTWVVRRANCPSKDPSSGCRSELTRTVWDGSQVLYEIRIMGDSSANLDDESGMGYPHFGVVRYTHGLGLDEPVAAEKNGDLVLPHANYRGAVTVGTCPAVRCDPSQYVFPGSGAGVFGDAGSLPNGPPRWHGSLLTQPRDASGYLYKRNRYLDPKTGRFTQEDPIGLAGGLNLYGFANGDPVNFSDPFGLMACPPDCGPGMRAAPFLGAGCPAIADHCAVDMSRAGPMASGAVVGALGGAVVLAGAQGAMVAAPFAARIGAIVGAGSRISPQQREQAISRLKTAEHAIEGLNRSMSTWFSEGGNLPQGVTTETLQQYRTLAQWTVQQGLDKLGVQAQRIQQIDDYLGSGP